MKFTNVAATVLGAAAANSLVIPHIDADSLKALEETARAEIDEYADSVGGYLDRAAHGAASAGHRAVDATREAVKHAGQQAAKAGEQLQQAAQLLVASKGATVVPHSYIVVLKDNVDASQFAQHLARVDAVHASNMGALRKRDGQHPLLAEPESGVLDSFNLSSFRGYTGKFHLDTIEALIRDYSDVIAFIEPDTIMHTMGSKETEKGAPWGLARVSHKAPLSLSTYNKYLYDTDGGDGVTAYIVDTGVSYTHSDFGGRARWGKTCATGSSDVDVHGHGTHCAGTIGGTKYGVAKHANLVAVKVLGDDGSGSVSDIVKGLEYVVSSHNDEKKSNKKYKGAVINMSLGGGKSNALNMAADAAVKAGVHMGVAAGNENQDACNVSPASAEGPVTVGATALDDTRAYFSNYGKCVDIFAPGVNIESTFIGSDTATTTMSGTSMASPHVVGLLSYFLSLQPSKSSQFGTQDLLSPTTLKKHFLDFGLPGLLHDVSGDSPNLLAYNGGHGDISEFWTQSETAAAEELAEEVFNIMPVSIVDEAQQLYDHLAESLML